MLRASQIHGFDANHRVLTAAFHDSEAQSADVTATNAYTFTSKSLGAKPGGKLVIVATLSRLQTTGTIASCSIGGVAATKVAELVDTAAFSTHIAYWALWVENVTSANIVAVVQTDTSFRCAIMVFTIEGARSMFPRASGTSTASPTAPSVGIGPGGCIIAVATMNDSGTAAWTGGPTEVADFQGENTYSGALLNSTAWAQITATATWTGGAPTAFGGLAAAWMD